MARFGYAAKGVVHAVIGVRALREASGTGGKTAGPGGAMESIEARPFGAVLLVVLAAGLLGYAAWKLVQGITDADEKGSDAHGLAFAARATSGAA